MACTFLLTVASILWPGPVVCPGYLFTIPHFAGYPAVLLHLTSASEDELRDALLDAWLVHAPNDVARAYLDRHGG